MKNAFGKDVLEFLVDVYWNVLELGGKLELKYVAIARTG